MLEEGRGRLNPKILRPPLFEIYRLGRDVPNTVNLITFD